MTEPVVIMISEQSIVIPLISALGGVAGGIVVAFVAIYVAHFRRKIDEAQFREQLRAADARLMDQIQAADARLKQQIDADERRRQQDYARSIRASCPNFRTTSRSLNLAFKEHSAVPNRNGKGGAFPLDWCKTTWILRSAWATGNGHPCPWPREVAARLIQLYSNPGDLVVDPFNGSGITVAEAVKLERQGVGLDISRAYCQIARDRLLQGTMALGL